jgi:hypothetical protein
MKFIDSKRITKDIEALHAETLTRKDAKERAYVSRGLLDLLYNTIILIARHIAGNAEAAHTQLAARVSTLEQRKGIEYRGTWRSDVEYGLNDMTTYSSSLWICRAQGTRKKPGDGESWQLCSKSDLKP